MATAATEKGTGKFAITVEPYELRKLISLLNALPKDTQQIVRDRAQPMSARLKGQLMQFADSSPTPQAKLVAESALTPRDRLIRVDLGGSKKVGRKYGGETRKNGSKVKQQAAPAGALLWGSEWGSHTGVDRAGRKYTNRFVAPYNNKGYWINKAIDWYVPKVANEYVVMIKEVIKEAGLD